jgi:uncharacterized protein YdeI (YjbR/CyaY-like superfamily)
VWLWFRSPHFGLAAIMMRTSEPPHSEGADMTEEVASDIAAGLAESGAVRRRFEALPPSHRREYLIEQAKRPLTRARRVASMVERLAVGEGTR